MSSAAPQQSDGYHPQPHLIISTHSGVVDGLAFLPDGRRVVTCSAKEWAPGGTVKVWNLENGEQEGTSMKHDSQSRIHSLAVTWDGTKIISGEEGGKIKVWDVESHELVKEWTLPERCLQIAISPDDRLVAVYDGTVAIYTMEGRRVGHSIKVDGSVWSMCFSPDGKKLAYGTLVDIRVYNVDTGTLILGPLKGHLYSVDDLIWSHDGSRLFSGSLDETIRCWNSDTGEQIGHPWTGHTQSIRSLSLSPDGSVLASASWDKTVRFWDATTSNPIGQHLRHDGVRVARFSPSGEFVASAGYGGKIYLWRVPWFNSVENRVRTLIRCTSVFILTALSNRQALQISTRHATVCTARK